MSNPQDWGTHLDGIVASELRDSQGERLSVEGADISELEAGRGYWNSDHRNTFPDVIGRVTKAKKIFSAQDCEDDRQRYYWDKVKSPFIYAAGYCFDKDGDHRGAQAVAAILRNQSRTDSPLKLKASVEGGVLERSKDDHTLLKRTKIRAIALTFSPANAGTLIETPALQKSHSPAQIQADLELIRSYVPFSKAHAPVFKETPEPYSTDPEHHGKMQQNFRNGSREMQAHQALKLHYNGKKPLSDLDRDYTHKYLSNYYAGKKKFEDWKLEQKKIYTYGLSGVKKVQDRIRAYKESLSKALTAGYGGGSPTHATGGQVLQTEVLDTASHGSASFKYVACPECGKEQPYLKYQVKCRDCGKSFPFDTLANHFLTKANRQVLSKDPVIQELVKLKAKTAQAVLAKSSGRSDRDLQQIDAAIKDRIVELEGTKLT